MRDAAFHIAFAGAFISLMFAPMSDSAKMFTAFFVLLPIAIFAIVHIATRD